MSDPMEETAAGPGGGTPVDVLVVGAGPVGMATAHALKRGR